MNVELYAAIQITYCRFAIRRDTPAPIPKSLSAPRRTHQRTAYEQSSVAVLSFSRRTSTRARLGEFAGEGERDDGDDGERGEVGERGDVGDMGEGAVGAGTSSSVSESLVEGR